MALKSHTAEEIREKLAADPALRVYELDTDLAGGDDILLGYSLNDVRIDVALYYGWDDDPENWTHTERGWEAPSVDGDDEIWPMNPDTGLPAGWSLREIRRDEIESYLD